MTAFERLRRRMSRRPIARLHTMFGMTRVFDETWDGRRIRILDVEGSYQSATYLDEGWCDPPFPYIEAFGCVFDTPSPARRICMLGGGAYSFPKHVVACHPKAHIDVVEIDPLITQLAQKYFLLDRLEQAYEAQASERLRIITGDALAWLESSTNAAIPYDAIVCDCFVASANDERLLSPDAVSLARSCLTDEGLYVANVVTALEGPHAEPLWNAVSALGTEFAHLRAIPCNDVPASACDNVVVVASNANLRLRDAITLADAL